MKQDKDLKYPIGLFVGVPAYRGNVHYGHIYQTMSMVSTIFRVAPRVSLIGVACPESCSVDWSRNCILSMAIEKGADWCLMFDSDTFHGDFGEILLMIEEARIHENAAAAAPVKIRGRDAYNVLEDGEPGAPAKFIPESEWRGQLIEVPRVGTAAMAIDCNWIRKHWPDQPWFATRHLPGKKPTKVGEDISFCDGIRERGGTILLDGRFEPMHVGAAPMVGKQ